MEFFNSLGQVLSNAKNYPAWDQQEKLKTLKQQQLLAKNPPTKQQTAEAKEYSRVMVEAINKMDQYSIDKSEDVVSLTQPVVDVLDGLLPFAVLGIAGLASQVPSVKKWATDSSLKLKDWLVELKPIKNKPDWIPKIKEAFSGDNGALIVGILATAGLQVVAGFALAIVDAIAVRGLEKEASRVARFQAREQVLDDPRNFVNYTPEQLAEAKAEAKESHEKEPKKVKSLNPFVMFGESLKTAEELTKQHTSYERWKTNFTAKETEALTKLDPQTVSEKEKQESLVDQNRITTVIKQVELKSQKYLANVEMLVNLSSILFLGSGILIGGVIEKGIEIAQHRKLLPDDGKSAVLAWSKKGVTYGLPILGAIVASTYGIKIQKEAAKVGRFKAKQDLLKHPEAFIALSDEQKQGNGFVKPAPVEKKSWTESLKDQIHFFLNLNKDFDAYKKHEKEVAPKEYQLNEALKDVDITPEQLKKAKKLQHRAFYAFEKMDEKTQRYSDDVEGGAGIITSVVSKLTEQLTMLGTVIFFPLFLAQSIKKAENAEGTGHKIAHMIPSGTWLYGLSLLASLPIYATTIWAAQMKKTAAQVGVMLSMKELDDPKRMLVAPSLPLVLPKLKVVEEVEDTDEALTTKTAKPTPAIKKQSSKATKPVEAVVDSDDVPDDDEAIA
jgi:hypothetical protein